MELVLEIAKRKNHTIFKITGDLNYDGSLRLKQIFEEAFLQQEHHFILDFNKCSTISSYALSAILKLNDVIKTKKGSLKLICPVGNVSDVFEVLDIANVLPIFSSEDELWKNTTLDTNF